VPDNAKPETAADRLSGIHARIGKAAKLAGRNPDDITLIAVSKTHDGPAIRPLIDAGQRVFGENRVQESQGKWPDLMGETPGIDLHLIGPLQSNKADVAVQLFSTIHSVDRASLITAIAREQDKAARRPHCFLQVNIGDEPQKSGCAVADVGSLLANARDAGLDMVGLMAIPPADTEPAPYFALLAKIAKDHGLTQLSMGMSGDFETAIMLGATHIRVGTALFGGRA
jgi:PLP dependent protein